MKISYLISDIHSKNPLTSGRCNRKC